MNINKNYLELKDSYLFSTVAQKVNEYKEKFPQKNVIRLGIGDVTLPIAPIVVDAMEKASRDMGKSDTFKGYGEEQGYLFLRETLVNYYKKKGVTLEADEIFISDGAKSDLGNILDIFSSDNTVLIPDPVYPVYVDTNIMDGRRMIFMGGSIENNFLPMPREDMDCDIIYLCSPNNPTGSVYNREQLKAWVDFALEKKAVIFFDAAYEAFIFNKELPSSIYEIENAEKCAIEFSSLSKTAGFTGIRCGYTVVPKELTCGGESLNKLWLRRQTTKFNGVSYIVQRGAEAVFSKEGLAQTKKAIEYYMGNAKIISQSLEKIGIWFCGGENSPYIWLKCPNDMKSWDFFDALLDKANVVGTPGSGFGKNGEGYFRLTSFGNRENVIEAMKRIEKIEEFYSKYNI